MKPTDSSKPKPTPGVSSRNTPNATSEFPMPSDSGWTAHQIAGMIAEEVAVVMAAHALAPKPGPVPPTPETYSRDERLPPFARRPKPAKWMEAPDVTVAKGVKAFANKFAVSEHATSHHRKVDPNDPTARLALAERDYSLYPPGCGVAYGGPSFGAAAAGSSSSTSSTTGATSYTGGSTGNATTFATATSYTATKTTGTTDSTGSSLSAASNAAQFCIVVVSLSFAPVLVDLLRTSLRRENVPASLLRWALTAAATFAMGFVFFGVCRKPFARWLVRVSTVTGVSSEQASVAAIGIAFVTGVAGASLTQAAGSAIKWLLMGNAWTTFVVSILTATATPVYMEWRQRRRTLLKKALTICYDNEKSPDGLAVLFGTGKAGYDSKKDPGAFAMGVAETPAWARFREDELVEWLNKFVERLWPFVNRSICALVRSQVEPLLEEHRPSALRRIHFEKLDLGPEPIRVNGARWVGTRSDNLGASLELDLAWSGRAKIQLDAKTHLGSTIAIGVKDVEAYTKVMVTLQPLTPTLCPFSGLMVTLREKPTLEFDVDLPLGLEGTVSRQIQTWLETLVGNILETKLVWPERLVVPIGDPSTTLTLPNGEQTTQAWYVKNVLRLRDVGLVCLKIKSAENVVGTDLLSKADAVVGAKIKGLTWAKTDAVQNNNDPVFNHVMYLLVDDPHERSLTLRVVDADDVSAGGFGADVLLGTAKVSLSEIAKNPHRTREICVEFPESKERNTSKKNRPVMKLLCDVTYVPFDLEEETDETSDENNSNHDALRGVGMLTARVVRGVGLKGADDGGKSSDPFCKLQMPKANVEGSAAASNKGEGASRSSNSEAKGLIRHKTRTCDKTLDPEWLESFEFVGVSGGDALQVQCFDRDKGMVVGSSKSSLGSFEITPHADVVGYFENENRNYAFPKKERGPMEKTSVTRFFALNGDKTVKGHIELELTWQPFAKAR